MLRPVFSASDNYLKTRLTVLLTTAVVGIALSLPAGFYLLLENCQRVATGWDNSAEISLFLKLDLDEHRPLSLADEIRQFRGIASVEYKSPEAALKEFLSQSGASEALTVLEDNPLPAILLLQPKVSGLSSQKSESLIQKLRALPEVDTAQFDRQWIQRLFAIIEIVRQAVVVLSLLLAIAVLLIVGNTIRLAIYNRRTEIEVNKLFGATERIYPKAIPVFWSFPWCWRQPAGLGLVESVSFSDGHAGHAACRTLFQQLQAAGTVYERAHAFIYRWRWPRALRFMGLCEAPHQGD